MKTFPILVVAALLTLANPVHAQQLDLEAVTCKEFQANDKQTVTMILAWLQAFYTDANAKPVVDFDRMKADGPCRRRDGARRPPWPARSSEAPRWSR
jgi:hypothetical protein